MILVRWFCLVGLVCGAVTHGEKSRGVRAGRTSVGGASAGNASAGDASAGSMKAAGLFEGQIVRENGNDYAVSAVARITRHYRVRWAPSINTDFICRANIRRACPRYELSFSQMRRLGSEIELADVHVERILAK